MASGREPDIRLTGGAVDAGLKRQIPDKSAYTGRVGYTHRPCGQGQALSDQMAIEAGRHGGPGLARQGRRPGRERRPDSPSSPTRQITAASPLRRGELRRFVALWIRLFWRRAGARNDESPAWRPGLSNSLGLWGKSRTRNSKFPRFPRTVNSKTLFLRAGALGPSTAAAWTGRPSHRDGHGASIRLRLRGAPARTDPTPQPPTRAL